MTATCPRCGAPMVGLPGLAAVALDAHQALQRMKLALPTKAAAGLAMVAAALQCHAGACRPASTTTDNTSAAHPCAERTTT